MSTIFNELKLRKLISFLRTSIITHFFDFSYYFTLLTPKMRHHYKASRTIATSSGSSPGHYYTLLLFYSGSPTLLFNFFAQNKKVKVDNKSKMSGAPTTRYISLSLFYSFTLRIPKKASSPPPPPSPSPPPPRSLSAIIVGLHHIVLLCGVRIIYEH